MARYIVKAAAVVAKTDSDTGEGYFYKDAYLPPAGSKRVRDDHARLADLGLVTKVDADQVPGEAIVVEIDMPVPTTGETTVPADSPSVDPTGRTTPPTSGVPAHLQGLSLADLQAYADTNEIDRDGATKKDQIIAAIVKAEQAEQV